jgi:hypothetical protein
MAIWDGGIHVGVGERRMSRLITAIASGWILLSAGPALAVNLSVWADNDDLGFSFPLSLAYNPNNGKLLLGGGDLVEWEKGATSGTVLVPAANWGQSAWGCAYVPSRGSHLVAQNGPDGVIEVQPGVPGQTPPLFVDLTAAAGRPTGGLVQDGSYGYYKYQVTVPSDQSIHRFTLAGTNGVDSEYIPFSAITAAGGNAIGQQITLDGSGTVYLSLRADDNTLRGVYGWDEGAGVLVPLVQQPQIIAHTGQSLVLIKGIAFDAQDNLYFYDIYSDDILMLDTNGVISTFLDNTEVEGYMAAVGLSNPASFDVWYMIVVGNELVFMTGNVSGHVLAACLLEGYGDFDCDGDVDLVDYGNFASAVTGPVDVLAPGNGAFDSNGDDHIDLLDFAAFQEAFDTP